MSRRLTDLAIRNLKPGAARREIPAGDGGLMLVLQPSGARRFAIRYRMNGRSVKMTLARGLTLAAARKLASDAALQREQGIDPNAARKAARVKAMESTDNTVAAVCANFMKRERHKFRSASAMESTLRRLIYPHLGAMPIAEVRRSHINAMLDHVEDHQGSRMADVTKNLLRQIMNWHAGRSDDFTTPFARGTMKDRSTTQERTRVLDDDELRALWQATEDGTPYSSLIRFLLLTTARRDEARAMKWGEVGEDGIWELPAARSKTGVPVFRPLSEQALEIIKGRPRIADCEFVFTVSGRSMLGNLSAAKAALDERSGVRDWVVHDIRRTSRTLMARAGVRPDYAERCLGHVVGGIEAVYNRHDYATEKREAFEALALLVSRIVNPPTDVVDESLAERRRSATARLKP
jgi:integrase